MSSALWACLPTGGPTSSAELVCITTAAQVVIVLGVCSFLALLCISAPYGRYSTGTSRLWGFALPGRLCWVLQELPCVVASVYFYATAPQERTQPRHAPSTILLALFFVHYFRRTFVFPFQLRSPKPTRAFIFLLAAMYCSVNGTLQARFLTAYSNTTTTVTEPHFVLGVGLFVLGMAINIHSDHIVINLRKEGKKEPPVHTPGGSTSTSTSSSSSSGGGGGGGGSGGGSDGKRGYKIPRGGAFEYVSGANFMGEILEWIGFAIAGWSWPALSFAVFTAGNIAPRALQHHKWYKKHFGERYPKHRKALIPFVL